MIYYKHGIAILTITALATTHAYAATDADTPAVTPYRPSVSTPATLSAPGWLEGEFGGQHSKDDGSIRQDTLPYTLKLAFTPDWGIRVGGNALVRKTDADGINTTGFGDTAIVLKHRFAINEASAFGLEAGVNTPTAKAGLGSGKADYSLNAIYSADIGEYHTDVNVIGTRQGAVQEDINRWQSAWAASLSRAINDNWGVVSEFSGTHQHGTPDTTQFLLASSYNASKSLVLDFGAARGLTGASPDWSVFAGLTVMIGRVF